MMFTRITRDGEPLRMPHGWGWWHVMCITKVNTEEGGNIRSTGEHVVQGEWTFTDDTDGEVLHLLPGDVLEMWRQ